MKKPLKNPLLPRTSVFSLICLLILCNTAYGQTDCSAPTCFRGDVRLDSAEAITPEIRAYTRIEGNFTIGDGETGEDIDNDDLTGLQLDTITGNLKIEGTALTELNAFNSLEKVGGNLEIGDFDATEASPCSGIVGTGNDMIETIAGFNRLITVDGKISIRCNDALRSLSAFARLTTARDVIIGETATVDSQVRTAGNARLETISKFRRLTTVEGDLRIEQNDLLVSIPSFALLSSVGGNLIIRNNDELRSVPGFNKLESVNQSLRISENAHLKSISGFKMLRTVRESLQIRGNIRFFSLSDFPSLRTVGGTLAISNHGILFTAPSFPSLRTIGDALIMDGNGFRSIPGFDNLEYVGGGFSVVFANYLETISGFNKLDSIGGELTIGGNEVLRAIGGFNELKRVGGEMVIAGNTALTFIHSFPALSILKDNLNIHNNDNLVSISGFDNLEIIEKSLLIGLPLIENMAEGLVGNDVLETVSGFGKLRSVGLALSIVGNAKLTLLPDFARLTSIGTNLLIVDNDSLRSVSGFDMLESVADLHVWGNAKLTSLPSFSSLATVEGALSIFRNDVLESIPDFTALTSVGGGLDDSAIPIFIESNSMLAMCCGVFPFLQESLPEDYILGGNGIPNINDNAEDCISLEAINYACGHELHVSTTTTNIRVDIGDDNTITIRLPPNSTEAVFTIDLSGTATGWIASEPNDDGHFLNALTAMGNDGESLTISYSENTRPSPRTTTLTLSTTGPGTPISRTLRLTQAAVLASTLGVFRTEGEVVLYPNPVSGLLHISGLQGRALIRISTLGGRILRRASVSASTSSIDVSDLRGGTYVVVIESSEAALSRKLVIIE